MKVFQEKCLAQSCNEWPFKFYQPEVALVVELALVPEEAEQLNQLHEGCFKNYSSANALIKLAGFHAKSGNHNGACSRPRRGLAVEQVTWKIFLTKHFGGDMLNEMLSQKLQP